MSKTPRQRAEACFAVARSTTHAGERDNAISLGTNIATSAGLSLDLFDIPGRVRAKPTSSTGPNYSAFHEYGGSSAGPSRPFYTASKAAEEAFDRAAERMRRRMDEELLRAAMGGRSTLWGDTIPRYGRNPSDAVREFREAEERMRFYARASTKPTRVLDAVTVLREVGALVDAIPTDQGGGWAIRFADGMGTATDDEVLEMARRVREKQARA